MGNSNSGSLDFEYSITASDYTPIRKLDDFLFGEFFEVKHNSTNDILLLKIKTITDPHKYQQTIEQSFQRLSLSHRNLSKIHGFAGRESTTPLSITYKIYIYFQPLPKDLAKMIKAQKSALPSIQPGSTKFLPESELTSLMEQFIDVLEYLQVNGISHGDIRPEACFLTEQGNLMLCDRRLIYDNESDFPESSQEKNVLFSPGAFEAYVKKDKNFKENRHKRDVFSVGMTLLECATYKRSAHIYEWGSHPQINRELLATRIYELQSRYSPRTIQILAEMLKFEESSRPDFIRLKKWITGSEPIGIMSVPTSPTRKSEGHPSPNRSRFTDALSSPQASHRTTIHLTPGYEKVAFQTVSREPQAFDKIVHGLEVPKKKGIGGRDAEDEVVEFETEESPKKLNSLGAGYQTNSVNPAKNYSSLSKEVINQSIKQSPYSFLGSPTGYQSINLSSTSYLGTHLGISEPPSLKVPTTTYDYNYTKDHTDYNAQMSVDNIMKKAQASNTYTPTPTTTAPYTYTPQVSYRDPIPNSPTKPYIPDRDSLSVSTDTHTVHSGGLSSPQLASPYMQVTSPSGGRSTSVYFGGAPNLSYTSPEVSQKKYSEGSYATYSHTPLDSHSYKPPGYSTTTSNYLLPPLSHHNSASTNKMDSSLSLNLSADTEQWRSVVADGYSTVLSVGPSSPKSGVQAGTGDLLSQQLKSLAPNKYSTTSGNPFSYQIHHNESGSRTSIEQDEELFDKNIAHLKYKKSAFSNQGSMQVIRTPSHTTPNTMKELEHKSYSVNNSMVISESDTDTLFKKAMERSQETFNMIKSRENLDYSKNGSIMNNESLLDRMRREGLSTGYKHY